MTCDDNALCVSRSMRTTCSRFCPMMRSFSVVLRDGSRTIPVRSIFCASFKSRQQRRTSLVMTSDAEEFYGPSDAHYVHGDICQLLRELSFRSGTELCIRDGSFWRKSRDVSRQVADLRLCLPLPRFCSQQIFQRYPCIKELPTHQDAPRVSF